MSKSPVALIILDGFALREEDKGNAVAQANKPNFDRYWNKYPHARCRRAEKQSVFLKDKWGTLKSAT